MRLSGGKVVISGFGVNDVTINIDDNNTTNNQGKINFID